MWLGSVVLLPHEGATDRRVDVFQCVKSYFFTSFLNSKCASLWFSSSCCGAFFTSWHTVFIWKLVMVFVLGSHMTGGFSHNTCDLIYSNKYFIYPALLLNFCLSSKTLATSIRHRTKLYVGVFFFFFKLTWFDSAVYNQTSPDNVHTCWLEGSCVRDFQQKPSPTTLISFRLEFWKTFFTLWQNYMLCIMNSRLL